MKCYNIKNSVLYILSSFLVLSLSRFSPLCVSCNEPIVPDAGSEETLRVVALEKNFHLKCYRCEVRRHFHLLSLPQIRLESCLKISTKTFFDSLILQDCARPLSIEADADGCYPLDGRILCMKCHTQRAKQAKH